MAPKMWFCVQNQLQIDFFHIDHIYMLFLLLAEMNLF